MAKQRPCDYSHLGPNRHPYIGIVKIGKFPYGVLMKNCDPPSSIWSHQILTQLSRSDRDCSWQKPRAWRSSCCTMALVSHLAPMDTFWPFLSSPTYDQHLNRWKIHMTTQSTHSILSYSGLFGSLTSTVSVPYSKWLSAWPYFGASAGVPTRKQSNVTLRTGSVAKHILAT